MSLRLGREFSLIIPVYRNEASLPALLECLRSVNAQLGNRLEVLFVVDGSPDRSHQILREKLANEPYPSRLLLLSRNFGSFAAIRAGLRASRGKFCAVMAADLQEPAELAVKFFESLASDECDIAIGSREQRADPLFSRLPAQLYWWLYRRFINAEIPPGGVDVFACNGIVRDQLLNLDERNTSLVGLLFWLGFRRQTIPYARLPRRHGRSAWSFRRKMHYLLDSVFSFTDMPITILAAIGACGMAIAGALMIVIVFMRLTGRIQVVGYAANAVITLFFAALNLFGIGVVGSYTWRAFENTKYRPDSIVVSTQDFAGKKNEENRRHSSKRAVRV